MLSYQHAYHAGNGADLHKHAALTALLTLLTSKRGPIRYLESHAGRGLYDLASPEAQKTAEAEAGIHRVAPRGAFGTALAKVRTRYGPSAYPGSPLLAKLLLRPSDRMMLCELHPSEYRALARTLSGPSITLLKRDGHDTLPGLCPRPPVRGLALIDPSYEVKSEYATAAETALAVRTRWPSGVVMVWYPILPAGRHEDLLARLRSGSPSGRLVSEARFRPRPARGMSGSGLAILNAPEGAEGALAEAWAPLEDVLDFA